MRKQEKKILFFSLFFGIALFLLIVFCINFYFYKTYIYTKKGKIIAIVNRQKIYENDIIPRLNYISMLQNTNLTVDKLDYEILKAIILEAYFDNVILNKFYKHPFSKQKIDMLVNDYKKKLIREEFLNKYIFNKISELDLLNKYNELVKQVKDKEERKISHILVKNQEEAEKIRKSIKNSDDFAKQAKRFSLDKASAEYGGSLGYLLKEEIKLEELRIIAFLLKLGEISKPIYSSEGWHLIRVDDIRLTEPKPFDEVKSTIKDILQEEAFNAYMKKIINGYEPKLINKK